MTTQKPLPPVYVWAWEIEEGMCRWAEPSREKLMAGLKPSPEARPVRCRLVPEAVWRRLAGGRK